MVICNGCGTRVTAKVAACPKCGASVDATNAGPTRSEPRPVRWVKPAVLAAVFMLVAAGVWLLLR